MPFFTVINRTTIHFTATSHAFNATALNTMLPKAIRADPQIKTALSIDVTFSPELREKLQRMGIFHVEGSRNMPLPNLAIKNLIVVANRGDIAYSMLAAAWYLGFRPEWASSDLWRFTDGQEDGLNPDTELLLAGERHALKVENNLAGAIYNTFVTDYLRLWVKLVIKGEAAARAKLEAMLATPASPVPKGPLPMMLGGA